MQLDIAAMIANLTHRDLSGAGMHRALNDVRVSLLLAGVSHVVLAEEGSAGFEIYGATALESVNADFDYCACLGLGFTLSADVLRTLRVAVGRHLHHVGDDIWLGEFVTAILSSEVSPGREWINLRLIPTKTSGAAPPAETATCPTSLERFFMVSEAPEASSTLH